MIGQAHLETALSAYLFEYLVAVSVTRNGENMTVPSQPLVFLYDTFGNVQKTDVRFGVGLLSSGDYPQVAVEECLQAVGGLLTSTLLNIYVMPVVYEWFAKRKLNSK